MQRLPKEHDGEGLRANAPDERLLIKQAKEANGNHQKATNQDEPGFRHFQHSVWPEAGRGTLKARAASFFIQESS
jgi:hypothetical protein